MSTIGNRIRNRRIKLGLSVDDLASKLGKNRATVYRYESDEIENFPVAIIKPLASILEVSPAYLMGWSEETNSNNNINTDESSLCFLPQTNIRNIPIFESVAAGFGAVANAYPVDYMPLYIENEAEAEETICVTVKGDSMYPKIEDGDLIQVRKQTSVDSGKIAVVLIDGEDTVVKKVVYDNNTIQLLSINPEYAPRIFSGSEVTRLQILGLVRKIIKSVD